jgi:hypothetical protein
LLKIVKSGRYKIYRAKVDRARKVWRRRDGEKQVLKNVDDGNRILIKAVAT